MSRYSEKKCFSGVLKRVGTTGVLVLASSLAFHGQVFAQGAPTCPAGISVDFDGDTGPFSIDETIPIKVTLSMGATAAPTDVDISHFSYLLDCGDGETYPTCTPQGNTVEFLGNVATNCSNSEGENPTPIVAVDDGLVTIDFTATKIDTTPSAIRLPSAAVFPLENSCEVTFDVSVAAVDSQNAEQEVVEITGWGETDAICTNTAESSGTSASLSLFIENPNVIIWTTKDFTDNNDAEIDANFFCDSGSYTDKVFSITDPETDGIFDKKGFVVYNIPGDGVNCRVWEDPVPSGYSESYEAGYIDPAVFDDLGVSDNENQPGCVYSGLESGQFTCHITNTPDPATFTVNKEWVIYNSGGNEVDEIAHVSAFCDKPIYHKQGEGPVNLPKQLVNGGPYQITAPLGDGESLVGSVDVTTGEAKCWSTETTLQSGVESFTDDCEQQQTLKAGGSAECTWVNTVFFEGIPTLSQYGKMLLVLLMLGVGVLGFRRFV